MRVDENLESSSQDVDGDVSDGAGEAARVTAAESPAVVGLSAAGLPVIGDLGPPFGKVVKRQSILAIKTDGAVLGRNLGCRW